MGDDITITLGHVRPSLQQASSSTFLSGFEEGWFLALLLLRLERVPLLGLV